MSILHWNQFGNDITDTDGNWMSYCLYCLQYQLLNYTGVMWKGGSTYSVA